jgi:hypothetical protein
MGRGIKWFVLAQAQRPMPWSPKRHGAVHRKARHPHDPFRRTAFKRAECRYLLVRRIRRHLFCGKFFDMPRVMVNVVIPTLRRVRA